MQKLIITQLQYPDIKPSSNGFLYMAWITKGEFNYADFRTWNADNWELQEGEIVVSFIEQGRKKIDE